MRFSKKESKRLAAHFAKNPKSATNVVFLRDVLEEAVDVERFDLLEAAKNVIGERMLGQIDPKMRSRALDQLEKVLYKIQKETQ